MIGSRDIIWKKDFAKELILDKHISYLEKFGDDDQSDQIMAEHLKMSGYYWGLNALSIINHIDNDGLPDQSINKALEFIKNCQHPIDGGFRAAPNHDSHILHTLSAVQNLIILNKLTADYIDIEKCVNYIRSLQQDDGSFFGDKWGEVDTRFSCCALATLKLLNRLEAIDLNKAVDFVLSCNNQIDGGFGRMPGSESHTAYVYCCISSLAIANQLHRVDKDSLGRWLSERQLPSGGLNGRPEKLPDLCYSWWCLASLMMIGKTHLINHKQLLAFILACQDEELGGFSDRPGNQVDPYHTMFGLASISLICDYYKSKNERDIVSIYNLKSVNPTLCIPEDRLSSIEFNSIEIN